MEDERLRPTLGIHSFHAVTAGDIAVAWAVHGRPEDADRSVGWRMQMWATVQRVLREEGMRALRQPAVILRDAQWAEACRLVRAHFPDLVSHEEQIPMPKSLAELNGLVPRAAKWVTET